MFKYMAAKTIDFPYILYLSGDQGIFAKIFF